MEGKIRRGIRCVADLILPRTCVICGRRLELEEEHLCNVCQSDIPLCRHWNMVRNPMADRLNALIQKNIDGGKIIPERKENYAYALSLFFYDSDSPYCSITRQIKYKGNTRLGRHFGKLLGEAILKGGHFKDVDTVIPVPLHPLRKISRGYNQAEIIASGVAETLQVHLLTKALKRNRFTRTQTHISIEEKSRNVDGAFIIDKIKLPTETPGHILLIDDVFTSGSTLASCHLVLRNHFPHDTRISVATLGFVGE